jgi:hypothetical protein
VLDFRHVVAVWVDPVVLGDRQLIDVVQGLADQFKIPVRIRRRTLLQRSRFQVWQDIVRLLVDGEKPLIQLVNRADASPAFREWAQSVNAARQAWLWDRFARYLYHGTLRYLTPVRADVGSARVEVAEYPEVAGSVAHGLARVAERTTNSSVRACGHLVQTWDNGTCYACVGAKRSQWRYDQ